MAISVRDHLPGETTDGVSLRELRETEEERTGEQIGPSVRELLDARRCSTLTLGNVHFTRGDSSVLEELLSTVRSLTDDPRNLKPLLEDALSGEPRGSPMPVRIDVWVDGEFDRALHLEVLDSGTEQLEGDTSPILFASSVVLRLHESAIELAVGETDIVPPRESGPLAVEIGRVDGPDRVVHELQGVGGTYDIECALDVDTERPPTAEELIDRFAARGGDGAWAKLDRQTIADELRETIASPELIRQGPTSLCGPSCVLYSLAERAPRRYVRLAMDLFDDARFDAKTARIDADDSLRSAEVPREDDRSIRQVDWLMAGPMRNSANRLFKVEGQAHDLASITTAGEVAMWARELLGYEDLSTSAATITASAGFSLGDLLGPVDSAVGFISQGTELSAEQVFRDAVETVRDGGEAFLMTTVKMFEGATRRDNGEALDGDAEDLNWFWDSAPNIARHWVTIREEGPDHPLDITNEGRYVFDAFTWGAYVGVDAAASHFERHTFMVVCARVGHEP